jgi:hypothetical protein
MQRSSQSIGAIAGALAKAQIELANPKKSLTATIRSPLPARRRPQLPLRVPIKWIRSGTQEPRPARDCHSADHLDR